MEGIVLLGLLGAGYMFSNDEKPSSKGTSYSPPLQPGYGSGTHIYNVAHEKDAKQRETELVHSHINASKQPGSTIIDSTDPTNRHNNKKIEQSMSGLPITTENFLTNNQGIKVEPFFRGSGPPKIKEGYDNSSLINSQGGSHAHRPSKDVTGQYFKQEKTYGNVFGTRFEGARADKGRYQSSTYRTNESPLQSEKTPPIDSRSEINRDVGMIHAERNSVDNRRSLNNLKQSFGGVILGGEGISKREEQPEVFKNLPDKAYSNTPDKWLVTTGATDAAAIRPKQVIPDTNRQYLNNGQLGPAAPVISQVTEKRPMVKRSTNQQLDSDTMRNATLEGKATDDDHAVTSFFVYPNERDTTGTNYFNTNPTPVHKGDTTRIQDTVRPTVKETTNFSYTGDGASHVPADMSSDQYLRADLNPNKEIIAQGRSPTPENVKLTNGMDTLNMTIDKLDKDYTNHHISNMDKLYQEIPTSNTCKFTTDKIPLNNKKISDRLDPQNLDPFRNNPYTHSLASF